ncbi:hypothetical protein Hamer_G016461, partial [Homarus americanus]
MASSTSEPTSPDPTPEFYVDEGVLLVCLVSGVTTLVCGVVATAGIYLGDVPKGAAHKTTGARVLLCSYAAAGLLHFLVFTPVLMSALVHNNNGEGVGVVTITYERYTAVTSPLSNQLSTRLGLLLAGWSWVCGGVVGVLVAGGLPHSILQLTCRPAAHTRNDDFLVALVYVVCPCGLLSYTTLVFIWFRTIAAAKSQGRVDTSSVEHDAGGEVVSGVGVELCRRVRCPCHVEVELVTIARTSTAFCPSCVTDGWWTLPAQPDLQTLVCSAGQWTKPVLVEKSHSTPLPQESDTSDLARTLILAQCGTEMDGSLCPTPSNHQEREDTFTRGGVYIGSLESHMRTHQAFCSGMNVRSQGCQTGEVEASPPVIEWRLHPSASREDHFQPPVVAHVEVQCNGLMEDVEPHPQALGLREAVDLRPQPPELAGLVGDVCVRDARARLTGRTRVEAARALPAFFMSLVQVLLWLPLPIMSLTLYLTHTEPVWAWRALLTTLALTNLAPALAPAIYSFLLSDVCESGGVRDDDNNYDDDDDDGDDDDCDYNDGGDEMMMMMMMTMTMMMMTIMMVVMTIMMVVMR